VHVHVGPNDPHAHRCCGPAAPPSLWDRLTRLFTFAIKEEAVAFAEKNGWRFEVEDPQMRRLDRQKRFAGYGDNFRHGVLGRSCSEQNPAVGRGAFCCVWRQE
jgi:hypothetical protein